MKSNGPISEWLRFINSLVCRDATYMSGVQKIIGSVSFTILGRCFFEHELKLSDFGYHGKDTKLKALIRHYYNEEDTKKALRLIEERVKKKKYGSAGFALTGETKKGWTKQDFCMQACTVTYYPNRDGLHVRIFYRTTEVIKKFGADLVFLREIVLPQFNEVHKIELIEFVFSNVTVHPMFFPTLLAHHPEPTLMLFNIKRRDPQFFEGIRKWMRKYLFEGETSWVQKFSQARQTHLAMNKLMSKKTKKQLKEYFK